jgi:hypothetical protein
VRAADRAGSGYWRGRFYGRVEHTAAVYPEIDVEGNYAKTGRDCGLDRQSRPAPQGRRFHLLSGVSCRAKDACVAVGDEFNSSAAEVPVAEAWNGKTWTIKRVPG